MTAQDLRDLDYAPNWATPHPDQCMCKGRGWIVSNYDTEHACCYHADRSNEAPAEPAELDGEADDAAWDAYDAACALWAEADNAYQAERRLSLYSECVAFYRRWSSEHSLLAEFEAAVGSVPPQKQADAAATFYDAQWREEADRAARAQGYSGYSEMLWDE
jgi:hypothetical protein